MVTSCHIEVSENNKSGAEKRCKDDGNEVSKKRKWKQKIKKSCKSMWQGENVIRDGDQGKCSE